MSFASLLNKTCTIQSVSEAASNSGTLTQAYANRTTNAKCTIQPKRGDLSTEEHGQDTDFTHVGFFEFSETIIKGDKVIESSVEYIVVFVPDAAGRGHHKEVILEQLPG